MWQFLVSFTIKTKINIPKESTETKLHKDFIYS